MHIENEHMSKEIFCFKCRKCNKEYDIINDFLLHFFCNHLGHCLHCNKCKQTCINLIELHTHYLNCKEANNAITQAEYKEENSSKTSVKFENCLVCKEPHKIKNCRKFLNKNAKQRTNLLRRLNLCYKCFTQHKKGECELTNCENYNKSHDILLCYKV